MERSTNELALLLEVLPAFMHMLIRDFKPEVNKIMKRIDSAEPTIKVSFKVGQTVRLTEGAFADFVGRVDELYPEKGRAKVSVAMFGRETPLEVDILHLERV